jgi:ABC-2 type transport system permease protein
MSPHKTLATAGRVLRQLKHDPRTVALIMLVPSILLIILRYVFNSKLFFDSFAPLVLGIFPFTILFIVTSIAMLRERTVGTLERLMTLPMGKLDLLLGYALAFAVLALAASGLASLVVLGLLGVTVMGGTLPVLIVAILAGLLGMALGLFLSAFARSEFQAVQFMPAFVLPQLLICGLFVPREQMAKILQWLADIAPLTYVTDAMKQVTNHAGWTTTLSHDLIIVAGFGIGALILGAATIRRQE